MFTFQSGEAWEGNFGEMQPLEQKTVEDKENSKESHSSLSLTPSAMAWAMPNLGTFLAQSGLK